MPVLVAVGNTLAIGHDAQLFCLQLSISRGFTLYSTTQYMSPRFPVSTDTVVRAYGSEISRRGRLGAADWLTDQGMSWKHR